MDSYSDQNIKYSSATNILLIEDNPGDVYILNFTLRQVSDVKFRVVDKPTLAEGLKYLSGNNSVDLILLDLKLPDGQGVGNLKAIKEVAPHIPVIVLTGIQHEKMALELMQIGAQDYFSKSEIDGRHLTRSIRYSIERQQLLKKLEKVKETEIYLAYCDPLTGLPNRKLFYDRLNHAVEQARRNQQMLGLMYIDLNGFKQINDTLGHSAGDQLLKTIAKRLENATRSSDTVSRLGGDEFTVILEQISSADNCSALARKLLDAVAQPITLSGEEYCVSGSIGISLFPDNGMDAEQLVQCADKAMYRSKKRSGNSFDFFDAGIDLQTAANFRLENRLRTALKNNEFVLHYQPLVDVSTGFISSFEALVRWQDPESGIVYPDNFIPLAEESGLIVPLGKWVINTACRQISRWIRQGIEPVRIAVNISTRHFHEEDFADFVFATLMEHGLEPHLLGLEITESNAIKDVDYSVDVLNRFRSRGVQISLDDFGTGFSSLSYLNKLPVDTIKIDKSFVAGLPYETRSQKTTAAIIGLAKNLDLAVVAEGVETKAEYNFLKSLNCRNMQGFYLGKPMAADMAERSLVTAMAS